MHITLHCGVGLACVEVHLQCDYSMLVMTIMLSTSIHYQTQLHMQPVSVYHQRYMVSRPVGHQAMQQSTCLLLTHLFQSALMSHQGLLHLEVLQTSN